MRADPEEQWSPGSRRGRLPIVELLLALAVIAGLAYYWFWDAEKNPAETPIQIPPIAVATPDDALSATPDIPQRPKPAPVEEPDVTADPGSAALSEHTESPIEQTEPAQIAPLSPEEGDTLLLQQLAATGENSTLNKLISSEHPLDISAALIDGLGRGLLLRKIIAPNPPDQAFSVVKEGSVLYMDSANYARFDSFANTVSSINSSNFVETFHTLRPLYEGAFNKLGLDPDDFDNAVMRTLDLILATPEITEPIALKPKSVVYIYADPALESLPSLQKQLLRMGPDNIRRIKQQAQTLRDDLLAQ
jgi:hypothetical protein